MEFRHPHVFGPILLFFLTTLVSPVSGQSVPAVNAESLSGKKIVLPDAVHGKVSVFIVGFSRKSKDPTGAWMKKLRQAYAQDADVIIYQVAHLEGAPRFIRGMIVSGMKKGVPPDQQDSLLVLYEKQDEWKRWVNFSAADDGYVVVCDRSAQAVWRTHNPVNEADFEQLKNQVLQLKQKAP